MTLDEEILANGRRERWWIARTVAVALALASIFLWATHEDPAAKRAAQLAACPPLDVSEGDTLTDPITGDKAIVVSVGIGIGSDAIVRVDADSPCWFGARVLLANGATAGLPYKVLRIWLGDR